MLLRMELQFREQHRFDGEVTTLVSNNSNFIPAPAGKAVTVSWDDARTLFHEFGHALHSLLSRCQHRSLSVHALNAGRMAAKIS